MDRLDSMRLFAAVADRGSFSAASRSVGIPLASVSRKVGELEKHLGTTLLTRTTRKVSLTDAGRVYLESVKQILEQIDEAERAAAGEYQQLRGELTLTAPVLFGRLHVLPIVTDFLTQFPSIRVKLLLSDQILLLKEEHVDVAARIGELPDSRLIATRVGSMRTVVCASPQLLARHGTPQSPRELSRLPSVAFDAAHTWTFVAKKLGKPLDVPMQPRLSVSTAEAAVWAAIQGVGVSRVLHYQCSDAVKAASLQIILKDFEPAPRPVHLVHASARALPYKTRRFLDFAAERLRRQLTEL